MSILEDYNIFLEQKSLLDGPVYSFDLETSIVAGSPMPWDGAKIVKSMYWKQGGYILGEDKLPTCRYGILVGHNIKFDLIHLIGKYGYSNVYNWLRSNFVGIYDTMIAEYLITGQTTNFASLYLLCDRYLVDHPTKNAMHEEFFSKGLGADLVPENKLREYLTDDVKATLAVAEAQWQGYPKRVRTPIMFVHGWLTFLLAIAETNGLQLDQARLATLLERKKIDVARIDYLLDKWVRYRIPQLPDGTGLTNRVYSTALFNAPGIPFKQKTVVGKYKNGKPKTALVENRAYSHTSLSPPSGVIPNPNLGYPMHDQVLAHVERTAPDEEAKIATLIRESRLKSKLINTYLEPFLGKDVLHPSYHQTQTATGRLSSSKPNGQNLPAVVKALVVPPPGGYIVDADFKQLEVWAAAVLSQDEQMKHDVVHSDIHYETGKAHMGWTSPDSVTKEDRRKVKAMNFGIIYGGGPKALAEQSGVPENKVKEHIKYFKKRYPTFTRWQDAQVDKAATGKVVATSIVPGTSMVVSTRETMASHGCRFFRFTEEELPWRPGTFTVPRSSVVNYPVQSFATGDVVPLFLVYTLLYHSPWMAHAFFSTIHDSVSFYVHNSAQAVRMEKDLKLATHNMPALISSMYSFTPDELMPLELEVTSQKTWA